MRKAFPCRGEIFISFHEQRDSDVGCVKSSPWRKQSHFSWQKLCMFYRVTCSFRVFLGGNYIHSWNKSSCCCFDSPACIQFSCQLISLSFGLNLLSCPSYHSGNSSSASVTFLNKKAQHLWFAIVFYRDSLLLWWLSDGLLLVIIGLSTIFLGFFLCYHADFLVSKAV